MEPLRNKAFWEKEIRSVRFQHMEGGTLVGLFAEGVEGVDPDVAGVIKHRIVYLAIPRIRSWSRSYYISRDEVLDETVAELLKALQDPTGKYFLALVSDFDHEGLRLIIGKGRRLAEKNTGVHRLTETDQDGKKSRPTARREVLYDSKAWQRLSDELEYELFDPEEAADLLEEIKSLDPETKVRFELEVKVILAICERKERLYKVAASLKMSSKTLKRKLIEFCLFLKTRRYPRPSQAAE